MQLVYKKPPSITWLDRSEIAAHFVRPHDRVCDLGAGAQTLRRFLPATVTYRAVDRYQHHVDTWIADFDSDFALPELTFDVFVCMGVLMHLVNPARFLRRLGEMHPGTFIVVSDDTRVSPSDLYGQVQNLVVVARFRQHRIVTGIVGVARAERALRPLDEIILPYTSPTRYVRQRCSQLVRRVRHWRDMAGHTRRSSSSSRA